MCILEDVFTGSGVGSGRDAGAHGGDPDLGTTKEY